MTMRTVILDLRKYRYIYILSVITLVVSILIVTSCSQQKEVAEQIVELEEVLPIINPPMASLQPIFTTTKMVAVNKTPPITIGKSNRCNASNNTQPIPFHP